MRQGLVIGLCAMVLGGCTGPSLNIASKGNFYNMESKSVGALDPSVKTLITFYCSPQEDHYEEVATENGTARCDGRFVVLDINQGKQTGYLTGVFSSAMQGAAFAGGMYLLGDGIRDGGSTTNNNNDTSSRGGDSASLSSNRNDNFNQNLNTNAAQGGAGGNGYGYGGSGGKGGSVNMGKHRR